MKRVVGFRDRGRHFKFQGLPGIVSLINSSHAGGAVCQDLVCTERREHKHFSFFPLFSAPS